MNPFTYVSGHWHAMLVGAIAWHFAMPYVMPKLSGVMGGGARQ
jgi:hypothetical protein